MKLTSPFSRYGPIGLDIGSCSVKAVQCRGNVPVACARFARIQAEKPVDAAELTNVAGVLRRQGFVGRDVAIVALADKLKSAPLELPAKGANVPIDRLARAEFCRLHKIDLEGSEFACWETPTALRSGKATSLISVAYPHLDAEQQIALYESAGLRVQAIDTHGSSLTRACTPFIDPAKASAILEMGWSSAVLVLVRNGRVAYERRIVDLALSKVHQDLERAMELSFEESLAALFDATPQRSPAVTELLADYFNLTSQELSKTIAYARHQYPESLVERIILTGGGAELPYVADQLGAICGIEAVRAAWSGASHAIGLSVVASAFGLSRFAA